MLISLAALLLFFSLIPYMVYFFGIYFGKKPARIAPLQNYPCISIIISAYNEEQVIGKRIANIKECHYPQERYELLLVDDCSSDNTKNLAKICLEQSGIDYRIIANAERLGPTRSYNSAIGKAKYPIVVTTDADVFFEPDALNHLIGRLLSDETNRRCNRRTQTAHEHGQHHDTGRYVPIIFRADVRMGKRS